MSENYQQPYRTAYFDREEHRYEESEISPVNSKPNSPRYGPGPPICTSDRVKGPRGCNLFVFHLPNEITNWDLYLLFRKYGSILSVHTMINKTTGLSKGYGFVSFSARDEAKKAIAAMDGFRLGKKRLKVQVKRDQDDGEGEGEDFDEGEAEALFTGSTSEMASGDTTGASTPHHAYCSRSNSHGSMDSLPSVDSRLASSLDTAAERSEASIEEGAEAEEFELKGK
ncbi:hypothetical protein B484DRAFT_328150 [Ochromonadaceae sp. CCMP2298]|nr:hypothetical protein B484DRAFT_328150 [Ochromonadaceae sp. CCMP2298]